MTNNEIFNAMVRQTNKVTVRYIDQIIPALKENAIISIKNEKTLAGYNLALSHVEKTLTDLILEEK